MENSDKGTIRILKDGPYAVDAGIPLDQAEIVSDSQGAGKTWNVGKEYPAQRAPYHLCRCGHSKGKPYCDGSHVKRGFDGTETADNTPYDEAARVYEGDTLDLMDREAWCAVARFCDREGSVWALAENSRSEDNHKAAVYEACACPSGRLTARTKDGKKVEPELARGISLVEDTARGCRGPLWVKGGIPVIGADGTEYEVRNRVTLCRCGESSNMPFCDASHLACRHMRGHDE